jgi:methionyl-tRNA synthetase
MSSPQVGADAVRYFLLREIPPTEDGDFTYEKFEKRYNSDLAAGLGNLVARVTKLAKIFNIQFSNSNKISNSKFQTETNKTWKISKKALDNFKFNEALMAIWDLIGFCDKYIERQKPWQFLSQNPKPKAQSPKPKEIIFDLLFTLNQIANLLQPFLPETAEKILKQIKTKKGEPLFPR